MEDRIVITTEILEKSKDYIPLLERQSLLESIAQKCISKVKMDVRLSGEREMVSMPERYQENRVMTKMCLMGVLALKYLQMEYDGSDHELQMPANLYDHWASSHIINQIEKMRSDKTVGEKAYRLLRDYREFCSDLYREIETLLGHHNDVVYRVMDAMNASVKRSIYENLAVNAEPPAQPLTEEQRREYIEKTSQQLDASIEQMMGLKDQLVKLREAKANAEP